MSRVIPVLLYSKKGLYKTRRFKDPIYVGDPINTVRIFNDKEVDELIFLDIESSFLNRKIDLDYIKIIAAECFMPLTYGGGIKNINDIKNIFKAGAEKVSINTQAIKNPDLIKEAAGIFGNQSIVVSIDVKKGKVFNRIEKIDIDRNPIEFSLYMEKCGAGELFVNSVLRDGCRCGFDIELIKTITDRVNIPVIACGGAKNIRDIEEVINIGGSQAAAAGSMFVFYGDRSSVLINYPTQVELKKINNE